MQAVISQAVGHHLESRLEALGPHAHTAALSWRVPVVFPLQPWVQQKSKLLMSLLCQQSGGEVTAMLVIT